jgi:uncharacterized protein (TIGR02284 family)
MSLETPTALTNQSIEKLKGLIRANIDSYNGLIEAADAVTDESIAEVFRSTAKERQRFADELKMHVECNDEEPPQDQSFSARVHQAWMNCRAKLNGGDPHVVLIEAEYGEDQIKAAYEDALTGNPGAAVSELLHTQYGVVKRGHDRIRDLRDAFAKK